MHMYVYCTYTYMQCNTTFELNIALPPLRNNSEYDFDPWGIIAEKEGEPRDKAMKLCYK